MGIGDGRLERLTKVLTPNGIVAYAKNAINVMVAKVS